MTTILLFSGGLDSTAVLYGLRASGQDVVALGVDYGQPHVEELLLAEATADALGVPFIGVSIPAIEGEGAANVYPGRNGVLIALAASLALFSGADAVAIGCNADDHADYLDCRRDWLDYQCKALNLLGIDLLYPNVGLTKKEVVMNARDHGWPIELSRSCYHAGEPCGTCPACRLRIAALA